MGRGTTADRAHGGPVQPPPPAPHPPDLRRTLDLDEITAPRVREWRAERLRTTQAKTTVAKAYRLLKGILETAVDDDLITRNPCRIKGAGRESAAERRIATVAQVDALANAIGIRWRLMVYLGAYGPMRPEELAGLRRRDVDPDNLVIRVRVAEPERTNGKRAPGETKSDAGVRAVVLPAFLHKDVKQHLAWFAEKGPDGLLFVGEKGAPFGRKWRRARTVVGLPDGFRFYDLRYTGHTPATRSGTTLKDTMVRAGQSSEKAALIYQHSDEERQRDLAAGLDDMVRAERAKNHNDSSAHPAHWSREQRTPGSSTWGFVLERVTRIELALSAWEATALGETHGSDQRRCPVVG